MNGLLEYKREKYQMPTIYKPNNNTVHRIVHMTIGYTIYKDMKQTFNEKEKELLFDESSTE